MCLNKSRIKRNYFLQLDNCKVIITLPCRIKRCIIFFNCLIDCIERAIGMNAFNKIIRLVILRLQVLAEYPLVSEPLLTSPISQYTSPEDFWRQYFSCNI